MAITSMIKYNRIEQNSDKIRQQFPFQSQEGLNAGLNLTFPRSKVSINFKSVGQSRISKHRRKIEDSKRRQRKE